MNRQQIFREAQKWIALLRFAFLLIRKLWAVMKGSQFSKQIFFPYKRSSLLIKQLSGKRTSVWGHFSMGVRVVAEWQNMSTRAYSGRTFSWGMLAMGTQWAISLGLLLFLQMWPGTGRRVTLPWVLPVTVLGTYQFVYLFMRSLCSMPAATNFNKIMARQLAHSGCLQLNSQSQCHSFDFQKVLFFV